MALLAFALVPKLRLGTPLPETPFRIPPSIPVRYNIYQACLTCVAPSTGIPPVQGIIDITSFHGIIVNIFQLLLHHLDVDDLFWFASFLPHLIFTGHLVSKLERAKLLEKHPRFMS